MNFITEHFANRLFEADAVEANLLQLGQNNAIELGGDTLVKDVTPEFGKQIFAVYKCKR